jgi:hypothetical protein
MVTVRSPSQLTNVTAPTTDAGQALFTGLHAGDYIVEVSAPGYRSVQVLITGRSTNEFRCEGRGEWRGRPAWVVHFRQRDDRMSEMRVYRVNGMSFPVRLKGRAWIDVKSSQILAMEADMAKSVPEIRLVRDYQVIEYGPVEFRKASEPMWLPKSADWYCNIMGQRYHRRHSFSQFLVLSMKPRESALRKNSDQK